MAWVVPKGQGRSVHYKYSISMGHLKSKVFTPPPENLEDLRCRIVNEVDVLRNTPGVVNSFQEMRRRAEHCVQRGGGHVEGSEP
jgi:hypothetical protein